MKVMILAGGLGTRLAEETDARPKPMVEIGEWPILWHIMKHYASFGFNEFYVALGYKGESIKRYFMDFISLSGSMTVDLGTGSVEQHDANHEDWKIHLVDTGMMTNTGGRVKRLWSVVGDEPVMLTYGDGVSNVNLPRLLEFHKSCNKLATVTAVRPPARFGGLELDGDVVAEFREKPQIGEGWINGGFMILEPAVAHLLEGDESNLELNALEPLSKKGELCAFRHDGFWQCMDTLRDKRLLESLWKGGNPPWKTWQ